MSAFVAGIAGLLGHDVVTARPVGGGCISDARRVELADGRVVFAKSGAGLPPGLLASEADGLAWLRAASVRPGRSAIRVPEVLALGPDPSGADVLVLEWIEPGSAQATTAERLGRGLARLHSVGAPGFGREQDCFIGSLPQHNTPVVDPAEPHAWTTFWFTRRIEPLARRACDGGNLPATAVALVQQLGERLPDRAGPSEPPARLHGDLWTGNVVVDHSGEPWVVDPAPYGGHREADLAMLHLFGRPAPATLDAYEEVSPLAEGWQERLRLWQLEPLLVHTILFGGAYAAQAQEVLRRYA